jgi:tol-pal system-associated acyl-CoA thioesterase
MPQPHRYPLTIHYEDTDFSGVVYHANYFKYFERARGELLGVDLLKRMWKEDGVGFAVYRVEATFKEGARYGDRLEIQTHVNKESPYRLVCDQTVWRQGGSAPLVKATVHLVVVSNEQKLVPLPDAILALVEAWSRASPT